MEMKHTGQKKAGKVTRLQEFMDEVKLGKFVKSFESEGIEYEDLPDVEEVDIEDILRRPIQRKKFFKHIKKVFGGKREPGPIHWIEKEEGRKNESFSKLSTTSSGGEINQNLITSFNEEPIGKGAFGIVHYAKYRGASVAIKVVDCVRRATKNQLAEVSRMQKLRHPFVVQCYGYFMTEENTKLHIVMDLMDMDACKYCQRATLKQKLLVMEKMACAVQYLHSSTRDKPVIFHNDIKPSNFLVSKDGENVKITDFGLSKIKKNSKSFEGMSILRGSFVYFAPEYAIETKCSAYTDIYSLGITFYELLFDKNSFSEFDNINILWMIMKLKKGSDYYPKYFEKDEDEGILHVPKDIYEDLLMKMWTRNPRERMPLVEVIQYLQRRVQRMKNP